MSWPSQDPSYKLGRLLSNWVLLSSHLDGGCEGHSQLLFVVGEEAGGCRFDLPGLGGRLSVKVGRLTCQSHKRGVTLTKMIVCSCQADLNGLYSYLHCLFAPIRHRFRTTT